MLKTLEADVGSMLITKSMESSNNVQGAMKRRLREALNIPIYNDISMYLGYPIFQGRVKRSTFSKVILKSQ